VGCGLSEFGIVRADGYVGWVGLFGWQTVSVTVKGERKDRERDRNRNLLAVVKK